MEVFFSSIFFLAFLPFFFLAFFFFALALAFFAALRSVLKSPVFFSSSIFFFFFFFFFAAERSVTRPVFFSSIFFLALLPFFFLAVFFFAFFLAAAEKSSDLKMPLLVAAATGVSMVEPRKPNAAMIAVIFFMGCPSGCSVREDALDESINRFSLRAARAWIAPAPHPPSRFHPYIFGHPLSNGFGGKTLEKSVA